MQVIKVVGQNIRLVPKAEIHGDQRLGQAVGDHKIHPVAMGLQILTAPIHFLLGGQLRCPPGLMVDSEHLSCLAPVFIGFPKYPL